MKKILSLAIAILITSSAVFSQNTTQIAKSFIMERESAFNKAKAPILVSNIDSIISKIKARNVSYKITGYIVDMDSSSVTSIVAASGQTYIRDTKKPFIYFNISKMNGEYIITTVTGSDSL